MTGNIFIAFATNATHEGINLAVTTNNVSFDATILGESFVAQITQIRFYP